MTDNVKRKWESLEEELLSLTSYEVLNLEPFQHYFNKGQRHWEKQISEERDGLNKAQEVFGGFLTEGEDEEGTFLIAAPGVNKEEYENAYMYFYKCDRGLSSAETSRDMHRRSCIITLYGLIEKGFKEFCEKVAPTGSTLKPKDLAGRSGIDQYKNYLTKVCGLSWDKLNPEWEFISTNFRKIRNAYVHDPSNAEEKSDDYLKLLNLKQL